MKNFKFKNLRYWKMKYEGFFINSKEFNLSDWKLNWYELTVYFNRMRMSFHFKAFKIAIKVQIDCYGRFTIVSDFIDLPIGWVCLYDMSSANSTETRSIGSRCFYTLKSFLTWRQMSSVIVLANNNFLNFNLFLSFDSIDSFSRFFKTIIIIFNFMKALLLITILTIWNIHQIFLKITKLCSYHN